jgi:hypothetical protein
MSIHASSARQVCEGGHGMQHPLHYNIYALACMSGLVMAALKLLLLLLLLLLSQELGNWTARL